MPKHYSKKYFKKKKGTGSKKWKHRKAYKKFKKRVKKVLFSQCEKTSFFYHLQPTVVGGGLSGMTGDPTLATGSQQIRWAQWPAQIAQGSSGGPNVTYLNPDWSTPGTNDAFLENNGSLQFLKGRQLYMGTNTLRMHVGLGFLDTGANEWTLNFGIPSNDADSDLCVTCYVILLKAPKGVSDSVVEGYLSKNPRIEYMEHLNPSFVKIIKRTDFRLSRESQEKQINWKWNVKPTKVNLCSDTTAALVGNYPPTGKYYLVYGCQNMQSQVNANFYYTAVPQGYLKVKYFDNN